MIYIIKENGKRERYGKNSFSIIKAIGLISDFAFVPPGCFAVGFLVFILFMNTYITAFGYGDEDKKQTSPQMQIVEEKSTSKSSEKTLNKSNNSKTILNNKTEKVENNNSATAAKPTIELPPLKQNDISIYLLSTKEFYIFGMGKNNSYYNSMHFTSEKKLDFYVFSTNINEKCRLYFYHKKEENKDKKSEKYVYLFVKENGFEITDLEKNLLWTVEKKDSDYFLKKGPNKEFAYRFGKFKQKSSNILDCYMMVDIKNNPKSISWNTGKGLYVFDENKKEKFYIPKCNCISFSKCIYD